MRLHIIPLTLLILLTGCGAKDKKLIEMESELVQDQGTSQICVYNDVFTAKGKKSNYTFIDIIKDDEIKETINTYRYLDSVKELGCFDFNDDGIKDIAVIGNSGSETKVLLYEATSEYKYDVFSGWSYVGTAINESLDDDFSMETLKVILVGYTYADYNSYDELIEDIKKLLDIYEDSDFDNFYDIADQYEWYTYALGCSIEYAADEFGYIQEDIDGDGIDELLLGTISSEDDSNDVCIDHMYTMRDGKIEPVFESGYREYYLLCEDGVVAYYFNFPPIPWGIEYYKYTAQGLELIEGVSGERYDDVYNIICYYYDSASQRRELKENEYDEMCEELEHKYNKPKFQLHLFKDK